MTAVVAHDGIMQIEFIGSNCVLTMDDNRKFHFDPTVPVSRLYTLPISGSFEPKETEFLRKLVKPTWVCIDIGACFGWYTTLLASNVGSDGFVHAFEPLPDNYAELVLNIELNELDNVGIERIGLSNRTQSSILVRDPDAVSGVVDTGSNSSESDRFEVSMSRLDDYVGRVGIRRIDFIKIDVEGHERAVLEGGVTAIRKFRPTLMIEIQRHSTTAFGYEPVDLFDDLVGLRYRCWRVDSDASLVPVVREQFMNDPLPDYNFIFQPE